MEIDKFIKSLEKDIKHNTEEINKVEALERLAGIAKAYEGDDRIVSSFELMKEMKDRPPEEKMFCGYSGIDKILDGFRHKQLIVLSAATKSGKTSFSIELTERMKQYNPTWFPFEEPAEELIQKFLDRKEEPPLFYTPKTMKGKTLHWIEQRVIEAKAKYNSQLFFIDHLHFIVEFTGENMSHQIGKTMRELKKLAVKWDVVIVLIAHLKKTQLDVQPTIEDLRDSSFIAQEADTVLLLWREMKKEGGQIEITNNVNISIQANRRTGKTGNVKFVFKDGRFIEEEWINYKDQMTKKFNEI